MASESKNLGSDNLEGYEKLAEQAKGSQLVFLIQRVLKDPQIYVFGELVNSPNVVELEKTPAHKQWVDILRIFAYGTYKDYLAKKGDLPALNPNQIEKLKQLSIASHAAKQKVLRYSMLMEELEVKDVRDLEDLIIDTIYIGLIKGKLDQKKQVFEVEFAIGRDIGPDDVNQMLNSIQSWFVSSQELIKMIDKNIASANQAIEQRKKEDDDMEAKRKSVIEAIKLERESQGPDLAMMIGMGDRRGGGKRRMDRGDQRMMMNMMQQQQKGWR